MSVESPFDRYRGLFNALPTPAWEEDFSGTWRVLQARGLVGQPADAVRAALDADPRLLEECIAAVRILDVSEAAVRLHRARDKQALLAGLGQGLVEESRAAIIEQLLALASNGNVLALDSVVRTLDGDTMYVHTGSYTGAAAHFSYVPSRGIGVAVLANANLPPMTELVAGEAYDWAAGLRSPDRTERFAQFVARSSAPSATDTLPARPARADSFALLAKVGEDHDLVGAHVGNVDQARNRMDRHAARAYITRTSAS